MIPSYLHACRDGTCRACYDQDADRHFVSLCHAFRGLSQCARTLLLVARDLCLRSGWASGMFLAVEQVPQHVCVGSQRTSGMRCAMGVGTMER